MEYLLDLKRKYNRLNLFPIYKDFRLSNLSPLNLFSKGIYYKRFYSKPLESLLKKKEKYDIAYLDSFFSYHYIDLVESNHIIIDFHNIHSEFLKHYIKECKNPLKKFIYKREMENIFSLEKEIISNPDIKKVITGPLPDSLNVIAKNIFNHIPHPMIRPIDSPTIHEQKSILFTGNFNWPLNRSALRIFCRLSDEFRNITFTIAGRNIPEIKSKNKNLKIIRNPETTYDLFKENSIFLSPVKNPSGINLKLIQAAYAGNLIIGKDEAIRKISGLSDSALIFKDYTDLIDIIKNIQLPIKVDNSKAINNIEQNNKEFRSLLKRIQ
ncbi:MAG: hypothetical protein C0601_02820 [Candidatus Muiribacterium halophilum]|uniref:Glycosyl transferase family 1 domain-containing protein n=1 Tax=Muiribacterium halophilum TaxID=2053465 RepID=A0A2N5ZK18_MUIH1|nr:MAG: hypothetical protein C0601_02820 [Candidatus Muirbacterium halophilum]